MKNTDWPVPSREKLMSKITTAMLIHYTNVSFLNILYVSSLLESCFSNSESFCINMQAITFITDTSPEVRPIEAF